ncbi:uncharacterized protein N7483_004665 [Penicillium malachiteum]|uniref:uncharacterized protein n=1 Tax=Penicillium malachiteum TaxID=1324776 RepID=UPI002548F598|nr:uncharacterized protein N7483_004665 [Penicillium malachiteum]KAJ5730157.1 hypothetical protein N7483_004665 [Penicillium malachiteum]
MAVTPSPNETCEQEDIGPQRNTLLTDNASPASVEGTEFSFPAVETFPLSGYPTSDERRNLDGPCSWNMSSSLPRDCEQGRLGVLPCPDWSAQHCHPPLGPVVPHLPPECFGHMPHVFGAYSSSGLHCCSILQGCNAQAQCGCSVWVYESPSVTQSSLDNDCTMSGASRNTHELTHDGIPHKPFACTFTGCRSRFKRRKALERHSMVHLGVKPYACWVPYCYRKFQRRDNLNAHYLTHGKRGGPEFLRGHSGSSESCVRHWLSWSNHPRGVAIGYSVAISCSELTTHFQPKYAAGNSFRLVGDFPFSDESVTQQKCGQEGR